MDVGLKLAHSTTLGRIISVVINKAISLLLLYCSPTGWTTDHRWKRKIYIALARFI